MKNQLKYVRLFEDFVSISIEDSTVNINIDADEQKDGVPELSDLSTAKPGDEVIVDLPPISLTQPEEGEDVKESEESEEEGEDEGEDNPDLDSEIEGD